ncbi:MFS transporter [Mycobacterium palustre]|uniref:Major facilitator superfamily (MFS) profile domain-containing protein n=1 Tax=Mycobacterium palustre TaxID=153971 RepID=A0A1X1ZT77_9MYCO|nr:MFS transporter [Mycobacterium palustre]MCV7104048.1 MFS transporter [Mycobacterium palustre]ORW26559.1 hypothetical protein AWC19_03570 [Mycobacterium palustre]
MHPIDDPAGRLRRAKIGVTAAFIAHAVMFSSWAAHIPHVKAGLGLSDAALGSALFGAPLGSVLATLLAHRALPRWGSNRLPALALLAAAAMGVTLATANPIVSVLGFAGLGAGVALLVPTAFSAAYSASSAGSAISLVAATGWVGYLIGPPLIGRLAGWFGLPAALVVVPAMLSVAAIAIRCTRAFDTADDFHRDGAAGRPRGAG